MKDIIVQKQKAQNVISIILIVISFVSCVPLKNSREGKDYSISRFKSKSYKNTQILLQAYDYSKNNRGKIPAFVDINGILIDSAFDSLKQPKPISISVRPSKYNVWVMFIGKKTINVRNLVVKQGDSVRIKVYMKDNLHPIY